MSKGPLLEEKGLEKAAYHCGRQKLLSFLGVY